MTTYQRALHVLIHDVRSPLGVAQGYLRMLREDRLPTPEARTRAIAQTQEALDRVARLCDDAARLADDGADDPPRRTLIPSERLIGKVRARFEPDAVAVADADGRLARRIAVPVDTDRLADAIALVLRAGAEPARPVAVGTTDDEVWFTNGPAAAPLAGVEFDCWRGPGFSLPLACRAITGIGGRIWATDGRGAGVAFPFEVGQ
ncbi:MAG: histidine kinase dimerization/phospho-acceptor domain-containing protein [Vicinamibacterales bacterium]